MSLGDFKGGGLWIHDGDLDENDKGAIKRKLPDGTFAYGRISEEKGKLVTLIPKVFTELNLGKGIVGASPRV